MIPLIPEIDTMGCDDDMMRIEQVGKVVYVNCKTE